MADCARYFRGGVLRDLFSRVAGGMLRGSGNTGLELYYQVLDTERYETIRPILHETNFDPAKVASRATARNEMNVLTWPPVAGAEGYRVYRAMRGDLRTEFKLLRDVGEALVYIDDAADDLVNTNPLQAETDPTLRMGPPVNRNSQKDPRAGRLRDQVRDRRGGRAASPRVASAEL